MKAKTSQVDDYFDFSFRRASEETEATPVLKVEENQADEIIAQEVEFDTEADRIIMVARLGSLFDCDKRMINA